MDEETKAFTDFIIKDESSDKKYFTIIPNLITELGLTMNEIGVYLSIKRFAGEKGDFTTPVRVMVKRFKLSKNTISKILDKLIQKGLIYPQMPVTIQTPGGIQEVNSYGIVDIWGQNNWEYAKKAKGKVGQTKPHLTSEVVQNVPRKVGQNVPHIKNLYNKEHIGATAEQPTPFSYLEELKKLEDNKRRDINVIGFLLEEKIKDGLDVSTRGKFDIAFRRYLRDAKDLKHYSDTQIIDATAKARKEYPGMWTGSTLIKILTK